MMRCLVWIMAVVLSAAALAGCGTTNNNQAKNNKPLTVYLWDTDLIKGLTPYLHEQLPDQDIEFIAGNNDTDLYSYLQEHGELPDIITVRRFAGTDAQDLQPYLLDFTAYDVVSEYTSYSLQYYKNSNGEVNWLPICGIPQTIIANKSLFDQYGLDLPKNFQEYAHVCQVFASHGIKPYAMDLKEDWSSHEILQAGGIGQLASLEGMAWRNNAESATGAIEFDDDMWIKILQGTENMLKVSHFTKADLNYGTNTAMKMFVEGKAAMFHGSPVHLKMCQKQMKGELVRLPYFSQTSDEGFIYMTPSVHVAFNKKLEKDPEKLDTAMKVLETMLSQEGQQIIANGESFISFNPAVSSSTAGMKGLERELATNRIYIRYSSQKSFAASVEAVWGLLNGTMDAEAAYKAFKEAINIKNTVPKPAGTFENGYRLSLNDKNGRAAASSILTTVRERSGAQLAFAPYYYFTSPIYKGDCTANRINLMVANKPVAARLYLETMKGTEIRALVEKYLAGTEGLFHPVVRYELPIASGMKLVAADTDGGFALKEILVDGKPLEEDKEYSILLVDGAVIRGTMEPLENVDLSKAWTRAIIGGRQPAQPEDYIELLK